MNTEKATLAQNNFRTITFLKKNQNKWHAKLSNVIIKKII